MENKKNMFLSRNYYGEQIAIGVVRSENDNEEVYYRELSGQMITEKSIEEAIRDYWLEKYPAKKCVPMWTVSGRAGWGIPDMAIMKAKDVPAGILRWLFIYRMEISDYTKSLGMQEGYYWQPLRPYITQVLKKTKAGIA